MKKQIIVVVVVLAFGLFACEKQKDLGILKVGYTQEHPYSYISSQEKPKGIFPDLAYKIAKFIGYSDVEWVLLPFDNLVSALESGRVDVIAAGMTINPQRANSICFSNPVVQSNTGLMYMPTKTNIDPNSSILEQNLKFAVVTGSIEEKALDNFVSERNTIEVADPYVGLLSVRINKANALVLTKPTLHSLVAEHDLFSIIEVPELLIEPQLAAFAFNKKDHDLVERWNAVQTTLTTKAWFDSEAKKFGFEIATTSIVEPNLLCENV